MITFLIVFLCTICGFIIGVKSGFKIGAKWSIDEIDKTFKAERDK